MDRTDFIRDQVASQRPLRIRGGGTKDWYGQQLAGEILDLSTHSGIIDYEPTELVITARSGTSLSVIEAVLAERGQMLAFEPPHFGAGATLGGAVASGLNGPRRATSGAARDFVLGAVLTDGRAQVLTFGGQVMKNVAGYDVSRMLAGSLGTLGVIMQLSVKVLPKPVREETVRFEMSELEALVKLNEWGGQPLPLSASCWHAGALTLRLSGAGAAVDAALRGLGGERVADGDAFWRSLREQEHPYFACDSLWRLSVPSAAGAIIVRGEQMLEWGGAQRWLKAPSDPATAANIRRAVSAAGGHATLFRGGDKGCGVFHPLAPAVARIHARLKASFDPSHIFNPGRMYAD